MVSLLHPQPVCSNQFLTHFASISGSGMNRTHKFSTLAIYLIDSPQEAGCYSRLLIESHSSRETPLSTS